MIGAWAGMVLALSGAPAVDGACVSAAEEAHQRGDSLAAARQAELCWRQEQDPRALLVASQASLTARRFAEARLFARRFLSVVRSKGRSTQRTMAELILAESLKSTGLIRVTLDPAPGPDETITLRMQRDGAPDEAATVADWNEVKSGEAEIGLYLDAGPWQVTIARSGFTRKRIAVSSVAQKETTVAASMRRREAAGAAQAVEREALLVSFAPARAARRGLAVELRPAGVAGAPALRLDVRGAHMGLWLAPGRWQISARAGSRSAQQVVQTGGAEEIKVRLR